MFKKELVKNLKEYLAFSIAVVFLIFVSFFFIAPLMEFSATGFIWITDTLGIERSIFYKGGE